MNARQPDTIVVTTALVAAGFLLYIPANMFPMTEYTRLGLTQEHTIWSGIVALFGTGLWPLGIIVFMTSITVPLLKLVGLSWLVVSVRRRARGRLVVKTKLHRLIRAIGRWSNVDVFTIAVFAPLMQFGGLVTVRAGTGAEAFIAVVVVTMIAARCFNSRLLWDVAEPAA